MSGARRRPFVQQEAKDGAPRFFPQAQPLRWDGRFDAQDDEIVVAISFPPSHFAPHSTCFRDHIQSESILLRQSLLYLYFQACLQANPRVIMFSTAFSDETIAQLLQDQDVELPQGPLEQLIIMPLTNEQVGLVMSFIAERVQGEQAEESEGGAAKKQAAPRKAAPNIVSGQADYRRIRNETVLARATELLVARPIQATDRLLATPTIDIEAKDIASSDLYTGHFLNVCNPLKLIPEHGGSAMTTEGILAPLQSDPNHYYQPVLTGGVRFDPIPEFAELKTRFLNPLDQKKIFQDPVLGLDANILGRMAWPHRSPPLGVVRSQIRIMYESLRRSVPWSRIAEIHPRALLINGLTPQEKERGEVLTKNGLIPAEDQISPLLIDPQANSMLVENTTSVMQPGMNTNDRIIQAVYPAQSRFMNANRSLVEQAHAIEDEDVRGETIEKLYREIWNAGKTMIEEDALAMPAALSDLVGEKRPMHEQLVRMRATSEKKFQFVMQLYKWALEDGPIDGFDTMGTVMAQLVHVLHSHLNLMSNQIPSMLLIVLQSWCSPTQNTNEKECIAMVGTWAAGKSKIQDLTQLMTPGSLIRVHGDETASASTYEDSSESDCRMIFSDEKFGMGNNQASRDLENSRTGMVLKTMLAEGFVSKALPVSHMDDTGGTRFKTEREISAARSCRQFNRNEKGIESPIESRLHGADVPDPPTREQRETLLRPKVKPVVLELTSLFGRMCGMGQIFLNYPGHYGLHNASECDTDLISVAMSVMDSVGLTPPIGRPLNQFVWTVRACMYFRILSECGRFKTAWSNKADGQEHYDGAPQDWERALMIQANLVVSPSDIIAGISLYYGCQAQDSLIELILATFVELIEPVYSQVDDNDPAVFSGFAQNNGKFYVLTSGSAANRGRVTNPLSELANRVYKIHKAKYCESHSVPVIEEMLRALTNKQIGGAAALLTVEHLVETKAGSHTEQRWAVSQEMLHKTNFPRIERILSCAADLQEVRKSSNTPCDYTSGDESLWLFPTDFQELLSGDILLNPTTYLTNPNDAVRRIALNLIAPIAKTKEGRKAQPALTEDLYNKWFRFGERCRRIEVGQGNTFTAYTQIDPSLATDADVKLSDGRCLRGTRKSGSVLVMKADLCNEAASGKAKPNMFKNAVRIMQAIMLPVESLQVETMHKLWFGVERNDDGEKRMVTIDPEPLDDISITLFDLNYKKDIPGSRKFGVQPLEDDDTCDMEVTWPGTGPEVTFEFADDLYGRNLRNRWRRFGVKDKYKLKWHDPGWEPKYHADCEETGESAESKRARMS